MSLTAHRQMPPTARDSAMARDSGQRLSRLVRRNRPLTFRVETEQPEQPTIQLPPGAVMLLMNILEAMAAGRGITIIPENAELTTVQGAEVLNVSRPFFIRLLENGAIAYRRVGTHRRVRMEDVMAYKARIDSDREAALDQLSAQAQELDMGYSR